MNKLEENLQNSNEVIPEITEEVVEKEPSIREIGRERIDKIGAFFSRAKEGFKDKVKQTGAAISGAANRAKDFGIAGLETVLGAPEALVRAAEYGVGGTVVAYEKGKATVAHAKSEVLRVKNEIMEQGKSAIDNGIKTVVDAKKATVDFGERALYRAGERISRPFVEFQGRRLRELSERVEGGHARMEDLKEILRIVNHMKGFEAAI